MLPLIKRLKMVARLAPEKKQCDLGMWVALRAHQALSTSTYLTMPVQKSAW